MNVIPVSSRFLAMYVFEMKKDSVMRDHCFIRKDVMEEREIGE
jgi:hypothetical protein